MACNPKNVDNSIVNKFKMLFSKINEPKCVMDNYYTDSLINKIIDTRKDNNYIHYIAELLVEPLQNIENYHVSVQVFLIRLLAFCVSKELYFTKIMCKKSNSLSKAYSELDSPSMIPSLRVAFLEVALSLITHNTGLYWLLDTGMWKEILSANNDITTVFVIRQKYKFVTNFLWRINDLEDEANVKLVLNYILKPLETEFVLSDSITAEEEEKTSKEFEPMLHMMNSIMSDVSHVVKSSLVMNALLNQFNIVTHLLVVFDRFRKDSLTSVLSKLVFRLVLAKVFHQKPLTNISVYSVQDFVELGVTYFNAVQYFIIRRNPLSALEFCHACNVIWNTVWHDRKPELCKPDGQKVDLQNKILFLCLVPSFAYVKRHEPLTSLEDKAQEYIMRLINASCEHTAKAAYGLRQLTLELDTESIVLQSVKRLSSLNNSMNNEQANLIFQGLFYILKEYIEQPAEVSGSSTYEEDQENVYVFTYVLEAILLLVKNYDINWQESLEVVCLYNVVYHILKKPNLSTKFVVTALNVIALMVKKFLPPNLSLLMESKPGSAMHELGPLIYTKMHDLHWEVRDSALELLLVCTDLSYVKFPPFQKQIIENDLAVVAAAVALNDHEFYVQASALRCLGAACKVTSIWDQLKTKYPDIQDSLLAVLRNSQEGVVRKEACLVLCELYGHARLAAPFQQQLYEQMVSAAAADFHWEVQLAALRFWGAAIRARLGEQGMLDGTFPPVTFSKETKKIVTLNKAEIQRRLRKILDDLSSVGCLTALTKLLHEDTEVEIMEASLSICLMLLDILKRYEVPETMTPADGEPRTMKEFLQAAPREEWMDDDVIIKTENGESDEVIESIVNSDDMNLLAHIYERRMRLQPEHGSSPSASPSQPGLQAKPLLRLLRYVPPHLFVAHLTSQDFKAVIEYKREWRKGIRSLESLLDDVLGIYEVSQEVNDLDCY